MAEIVLDGVSKRFSDGYEAVKDMSLDIKDGEFMILVGPSGCGKSTALRMIAGLETASSGAIRIDGAPVRGPRRDIGLVFQSPVMLPWRTILQNVTVPAEVMKLDAATRRIRVLRVTTAADTACLPSTAQLAPISVPGALHSSMITSSPPGSRKITFTSPCSSR